MADTKNAMEQIDEQFEKEEHELDEQIERLKRDEEAMRNGPLSNFIKSPRDMDGGPHLPGVG